MNLIHEAFCKCMESVFVLRYNVSAVTCTCSYQFYLNNFLATNSYLIFIKACYGTAPII